MAKSQQAPVISIASSIQEFEEAYRLRYKVFSLEYGDFRYANLETEIYTDEFDSSSSTLFVAKDTETIVGSLRVVPVAGKCYFGYEQHYPTIAAALGMGEKQLEECAVIVSRGVIAPEYRGGGLFAALLDTAEEFCLRMGLYVSIGAVSQDNPGCFNFMIRKGYLSGGSIRMINNWSGTLIYKRFISLENLTK